MEISHKKFANLKAAAHRGGKAVGGAAKSIAGTATQGGVGAAARIVETLAKQKIAFLAPHWYAAPAALLVLGHVAKRKPKFATMGVALAGAAGYALMIGYQRQNSAAGGLLGDASGVGDVADAEDAGAIVDAYAPSLIEAQGVGDAAAGFYEPATYADY